MTRLNFFGALLTGASAVPITLLAIGAPTSRYLSKELSPALVLEADLKLIE